MRKTDPLYYNLHWSSRILVRSSVSVFDISALLWAFSPDITLHVFNRTKSNSRSSLILWAKCLLFQQDPVRLGPSMKVSHKKTCIVLLHFSSQSDSALRLTPVCLVVFSRGVLTASVFVLHPDSLMMNGACLKSVSLSKNCPV